VELLLATWRDFSVTTLQAGGVFSGGLIGGISGAMVVCSAGITCRAGTCDAFAAGAGIGHAIGRLGMLCAVCCYRKRDESFLGAGIPQSAGDQITGTAANLWPREPTHYFEAAVELATFIFLMWLLQAQKI